MFCIGDQIGSYFLIQKLGRGAFGEVWLAEEKTAISTHKVALKLPNEEDIDLEAIRQEASVWESVKGHPNILPIIKADNIDGQIYIASEYAPDGSLKKWLKKYGGKAPTTEIAVRMIQGILSGLEHLHSKGVIHRDLKPENILLQSDTPRIADFGIARLMQSTSNSTNATGTPAYMAPECFYAIRSVQTDIWAVGIIFHQLLTGKLPFPQPDQISVMHAILNGGAQIQNDIPPKYYEIVKRALHKDVTQRYLSVAEMQEDLDGLGTKVFARKEDKIVFQLSETFQPNVAREQETLVVPLAYQNRNCLGLR
jgi:serine/threonine-protein kinase